MMRKRTGKAVRWLLKAAASYIIFFLISLLLRQVSPDAMGLTWEKHNDLCMLVMLLGPIYTTIIAKIILLFVNRHMITESDKAETGRGISMAIAGILLMADLAASRTIGDQASGYVQGKGLDNLRKSRRYPLKGKGFLNLFLPFCAYLLILEILTLLTCIILFEPLSAGASGGFIFAIGITVILLLMVPLIMTFVSGFQGDKAHHGEKLEKVKTAALEDESIVMEADRDRRKIFLRFPRKLFLLGTVLPLLVSVAGLALTRDYMYIGWVHGLRQVFMFFSAAGLLACVPLLIYWADCSGTSLVMRIYLTPGGMSCYGYSGSMAERTEYEFVLTDLKGYEVTGQHIKVRGIFDKKLKDRHGTYSTANIQKTLRIPRVFSPEQERALLDYLYERKQIFP